MAERQLEKIAFRELDIPRFVVTLKEYIVKKLSHGNWNMDSGLCQPELRYLYPIYFDSARVLLAECVAEFFQTGMICGRFKPQGSRQALPELLPLQMQPLQV